MQKAVRSRMNAKSFEQVPGINQKPKSELQLAYQSGLIGISKNYNYIYILLRL